MISRWRSRSVAIALLLIALAAWTDRAAARIPVETFAAHPAFGEPKISPNGRHMAVPLWKRGVDTVGIYDVDAPPGSKIHGISLTGRVDVDWVAWANDDRLLISFSQPGFVRVRRTRYDTRPSRIIAVDRDGRNLVVLFANRPGFRHNYDLSDIVHTLPGEPVAVLMAAFDRSGSNNLYRVNVYDGKAEPVVRGSAHTRQWLTDLEGVPRARWDYWPRRDIIEVYLRDADGDNWDRIAQYGYRDFPELNLLGFADDPRIAVVASRQTGDRYALFEYDVAAHALGRVIFQHPSVDIGDPVGGPIYDPETTKLIGVYYVEDVWRRHYFDPLLAGIQARLDAMFRDAAIVRTRSWSRDRSRFVVFTEGPKDPGTYHLYDVKTDAASLIGRRHPNIPAHELGQMAVIEYTSRDGTPIPGYLTMPPGSDAKNLPMVVMPHGGPEHRDHIQYDHWAQMLASRGYAVLQPNFRGSGGYGKTFAEAGYRQWGRRMQDDVNDGVKTLIANGTADADRICIVGASYGGYAALAGGAFTPDIYKCVVSIAGVSDLPRFMDSRERQLGIESAVYRYWVRLLGDPKIDRDQMQSVSPTLHARNYTAPVLLIHGDQDRNVPLDQSERMDRELRKAGKHVQFVVVKDEGHNFSKRSSDIRVMSELERFLSRHIGN